MLKNIKDNILAALKKYEQNPNHGQKKGILLTPQGGYFLYGNRFCSITEYELEFFSKSFQMQGKTVPKPLFFSMQSNHLETAGEEWDTPTLVSLIFQISLQQDEPLRGILLAVEGEAALSLFSDISTEALYRLSRRTNISPSPVVLPDAELLQYAETLRQNDLHLLTEFYLQGRKLKELTQ